MYNSDLTIGCKTARTLQRFDNQETQKFSSFQKNFERSITPQILQAGSYFRSKTKMEDIKL